MRIQVQAFAAILFALALDTSNAAIVTADFEDLSGQGAIITSNYSTQGVRFSPSGHFDVREALMDNAWNSTWFGFDGSGGCPFVFNSDFLGPPEYSVSSGSGNCGLVWVDYSNRPFSLLSLDVVIGNWSVTSSNGGFAQALVGTLEDPFPRMTFEGPEWTGIKWLLFDARRNGAPVGFDNFTIRVPEPGTLALMSLGLLGLGFARRRLH